MKYHRKGHDMGETIEKRLKDYKGYQVSKIIDNKGLKDEKITYMLDTQDGDNINCFTSLKELKKYVDVVL